MSPSALVLRWLRECFWNVLEFPHVATYVSVSLLCGIDYQVRLAGVAAPHTLRPALRPAQSPKPYALFPAQLPSPVPPSPADPYPAL